MGGVELWLGDHPVAPPIARRVAAVVAARADLPLDRLGEAVIVAEALARHAPAWSAGRRARLCFLVRPGALEVRTGPLAPGGARGVVTDARVSGVGSVVERLADRVARDAADGLEVLVVTLLAAPAREGAP